MPAKTKTTEWTRGSRKLSEFEALQVDAALQFTREDADRRHTLAELVLGRGTHADHYYRIGEVITVDRDTDSHVVEVVPNGKASVNRTTWVVVHDGKRDSFEETSRELALLHLLARRSGSDTSQTGPGVAAAYAARVLGILEPDAVREAWMKGFQEGEAYNDANRDQALGYKLKPAQAAVLERNAE